MSRLPHRPRHTARIVGPGRVFVVYLTRLVKVRGVEAGLKPASTAGPYRDSDAAVDGAGEDEATVVVRVLSNKVHATRGTGYKSGFLAELLSVLSLARQVPTRNRWDGPASRPRRRRSWSPGPASRVSSRGRPGSSHSRPRA